MIEGTLLFVIAPLIIGWVLDLIFGDPQCMPHPVVWFGKLISFGEHHLNNGNNRKVKGAIFAVVCIVLVFLLTMWLMDFAWLCGVYINHSIYADVTDVVSDTSMPGFLCYLALSSLLVFFCLAGKTLRKEVRMTFQAVDRSVEEGRKQVGRIVGRDTSNLSAQEIRTAALETLSENLSDGVVAPLFWFAFLGIPGMVAYKMVNTLDSMIGYQTPRYKDFGCWAAKIDDAANYIPARITAGLILIAAYIYKLLNRKPHFSLKYSWVFTRYFGPKHASPNSGWPEAALASILNCRFGGPHNYFGEMFYKPYIGTTDRPLSTDDMSISIKVCRLAEILMIILMIIFYALNLLLSYWKIG